ncbi:MAG: endonuclease III domain-containing protein [Deltaproteobacteria bacterium]|nr:endonuclease III domain-containing protein [Deltaproteobacteria bacterium]
MKEEGRNNGTAKRLKGFYSAMYSALGPQGWWPGKTRFEVIAGAILTQNTAWTNVEKAIANLKSRGVLSPAKLHGLSLSELAPLIRPAGYFNIKAKRLKNFTDYLFKEHNGSLDRLLKHRRPKELRRELLKISGIGPETADSIVLYAAGMPEFVVDAYTKRIFSRHSLAKEDDEYEELKSVFMENLKPDAALFNEYHALIVRTGKDFCRPKEPLCNVCPLKRLL